MHYHKHLKSRILYGCITWSDYMKCDSKLGTLCIDYVNRRILLYKTISNETKPNLRIKFMTQNFLWFTSFSWSKVGTKGTKALQCVLRDRQLSQMRKAEFMLPIHTAAIKAFETQHFGIIPTEHAHHSLHARILRKTVIIRTIYKYVNRYY